jgi:sugar-phosphatase
MAMECSAVLFDLDGVLIDSTDCVERHWRNWAAQHGLDADSIIRTAHGVRDIDTMQRIAPHLDIKREAALFAAGEVADTNGVAAMEGASSLLAGLDGAHWAIVTSGSAALAQARLAAACIPRPPILITGDDVARGKPDPQPYLLASNRLGAAPGNCVVVEDAPVGIEAGQKAGMRVIAVAFTYGREQLLSSGADVVIDRLTDIRFGRTNTGTILIELIAQ